MKWMLVAFILADGLTTAYSLFIMRMRELNVVVAAVTRVVGPFGLVLTHAIPIACALQWPPTDAGAVVLSAVWACVVVRNVREIRKQMP